MNHCLECNAIIPDTEAYCEKCVAAVVSHKIELEDVSTDFVARSDFQPEGVPVKIVRFER